MERQLTVKRRALIHAGLVCLMPNFSSLHMLFPCNWFKLLQNTVALPSLAKTGPFNRNTHFGSYLYWIS